MIEVAKTYTIIFPDEGLHKTPQANGELAQLNGAFYAFPLSRGEMDRRHRQHAKVRPREVDAVRAILGEGRSVKEAVRQTGISETKVYQIKRDYVPRLRIEGLSLQARTDRNHIARYATVEVAVVSKVEAERCWAKLDNLTSGASFPLHWGGTQVTTEESTAQRIPIVPGHPARLDIAMAIPTPGSRVSNSDSGSALMSGQVTVMVIGNSPEYAPRWTGEGCWVG